MFEDPADLFAELFPTLADEPFMGQATARAWVREQWVLDARERVCTRVLATGLAQRDFVDAILQYGERGKFAVLWGLDQALEHINPFTSARPSPSSAGRRLHNLRTIEARYVQTAKLNSDEVPGRLLFTCSFAGRPLGLPEKAQFFGLHWTTPEEIRQHGIGEHAWIYPEHDVVPVRNAENKRPEIAVACAPLLDKPEDLLVERRAYPEGVRYRFAPRCSETLRERIPKILQQFDDSGSVIGILPEAALSEEVLEIWREVLTSTPPPPQSSLKWLLLGSGPIGNHEPPFNRAILVDRITSVLGRLDVLLTHDKMYDYAIDRWSLEDMDFQGELGSELVTEDITLGRLLHTRESLIGRVAVLICEDLARVENIARITAAAVSHIFVPVLAKELTENGWAVTPSRNYVQEIGASLVIVNSLTLARRRGQKGRVRALFAVGPDSGSRKSGYIKPGFEFCEKGDDVRIAVLTSGETSRWWDFKDYLGRNI